MNMYVCTMCIQCTYNVHVCMYEQCSCMYVHVVCSFMYVHVFMLMYLCTCTCMFKYADKRKIKINELFPPPSLSWDHYWVKQFFQPLLSNLFCLFVLLIDMTVRLAPIYLSIFLSIYLYIYLYIYLSIYLSI